MRREGEEKGGKEGRREGGPVRKEGKRMRRHIHELRKQGMKERGKEGSRGREKRRKK